MGIRKKLDQTIDGISKFADDHPSLIGSVLGVVAIVSVLCFIVDASYCEGYIAGEVAAKATTADLIDKVTELYS